MLNVMSNKTIKSINESIGIGATTGKSYNADRRDDITFYLLKDIDKVCQDLGWNEKLNWTEGQREILYGKIKTEIEQIKEQIKEVELMTKQEKELEGINQQLKETPVANITIEFADKGQFNIVNTQTKQVIATHTAEVIKSTLAVMNSMQSEIITENKTNNNQV